MQEHSTVTAEADFIRRRCHMNIASTPVPMSINRARVAPKPITTLIPGLIEVDDRAEGVVVIVAVANTVEPVGRFVMEAPAGSGRRKNAALFIVPSLMVE